VYESFAHNNCTAETTMYQTQNNDILRVHINSNAKCLQDSIVDLVLKVVEHPCTQCNQTIMYVLTAYPVSYSNKANVIAMELEFDSSFDPYAPWELSHQVEINDCKYQLEAFIDFWPNPEFGIKGQYMHAIKQSTNSWEYVCEEDSSIINDDTVKDHKPCLVKCIQQTCQIQLMKL